ncbi:MAG: peptidylprolyl isomerase [Bacteroidetes bacterium]|nr:peptidylprolyl isomerase [Bacteroidota bacterium]
MRSRFGIVLVLATIAVMCGCTDGAQKPVEQPPLQQMEAPAPRVVDTSDHASADTAVITHVGTLVTSMGTITIGFYGVDAPRAVNNMVALAAKRFYNGILVHRVARDLVVQMGDPKTKDASARAEWGRGGQTADGKPLPDELDSTSPSARIGYQRGVVAMAHKPMPNSATSQFFICNTNARAIPYQYTIVGRVLEGMDVVDKMNSVDVEPGSFGDTDGIPKKPIVIRSFVIKPQ